MTVLLSFMNDSPRMDSVLVVVELREPLLFILFWLLMNCVNQGYSFQWLLERVLEARTLQTPGRVGVSLTRQLRRATLLAATSQISFHAQPSPTVKVDRAGILKTALGGGFSLLYSWRDQKALIWQLVEMYGNSGGCTTSLSMYGSRSKQIRLYNAFL